MKYLIALLLLVVGCAHTHVAGYNAQGQVTVAGNSRADESDLRKEAAQFCAPNHPQLIECGEGSMAVMDTRSANLFDQSKSTRSVVNKNDAKRCTYQCVQ